MKWLIPVVIALVIPAFFVALWMRSRSNKTKGKDANR